jgi:hypothetical protein
MGSYEDRRQAREWLAELEQLLGRAGSTGVSPDAKVTGFAAAAHAEALLFFADTLDQSIRTLRDDVVPHLQSMFGGR